MDEIEDVTTVDHLTAVIEGTAKQTTMAATKPVHYRCPVSSLARVDALAAKAGKSRNAMMTMLLDVGIEEVFARLSQGAIEEIQSREIHALQGLLDGETETISE